MTRDCGLFVIKLLMLVIVTVSDGRLRTAVLGCYLFGKIYIEST